MKPYIVTYKFYYDGEWKSTHSSTELLDEPCDEEISGSDFNSFLDLYQKYSAVLPFNEWKLKKGRAFYFYDSFCGIKEWKECKHWSFVISSKETSISMERLMRFDTEKVIKYLKERGITTCPMNL